jgi:hypothetical protein
MLRILLLAALLPACRSAQARPESRATLSGTARFPTDLPLTHEGTVRMTITGTAEVSDDCETSGDQSFIAAYDGNLVVGDDGQFTASLYPAPIALASGCRPTEIRNVHQIANISVEAQLGDEVGHGALTYQNLTAIDGDELQAGAFDELMANLTFTRP